MGNRSGAYRFVEFGDENEAVGISRYTLVTTQELAVGSSIPATEDDCAWEVVAVRDGLGRSSA